MTRAKAIELLQHAILERPNPHYQDLTDAMKLGIEALIRIGAYRREPRLTVWENLPSETDT